MTPLSDEQAVDTALSLSDFQQEVILLCSRKKSIGYKRMAEAMGVPYNDVRDVGRLLQSKRLAYVDTVRDGLDNYAGSALFLNDNGDRVRHVVELRKMKLEAK